MNLGKSLHKLGDSAFQHPWRVIAIWIVVLGGLGFAATQFIQPTSSSISIPGTEAQKAIDRAGELFPASGGGSGRIVFNAKDGSTIEAQKASIDDVIERVGKVDGVALVVSPFVNESFVSESGTIAYAQVQMTEQTGSVEESTLEAVTKVIDEKRSANLQIEVGGDLVSSTPGEIIGVGELAGVVIALVVLVMTLGSLIAAGMPIISALLAVGVSMAGLFALSQVLDINSTTPVLAVMLGLAVGIDYSLFIISKYRGYVLEGMEYREAAAKAMGTAGNAVVFAAFTVIIALAALSVVNVPFMTIMGLVGAASIAVSAIVAITLVPAMLGLAKHRVFGRKTRAKLAQKKPTLKKSFWYKWGSAVTRRPIVVLVISVLAIGVIALPARDLTLGLPTDQYASADTTERKAYDLLSEGFGVGFNGPLIVLVEGLPAVSDADKETVRQAAMEQLTTQAANATKQQEAAFASQFAAATTPEQQLAVQQAVVQAQAAGEQQKQAALAAIDKAVEENAKFVQVSKVASKINDVADVQQTTPAGVTDDGTAGIIQVIPKSAPADKETTNLITYLRSDDATKTMTNGAEISVTGSTALQEDINKKLSDALPLYLGVVVGLSLLLLILAFRSILVPIKATLGFLLSVLAMFGALVAVFQWGWFGLADAPGPIVSFIPIIAIGILFGLAMDYEFFLVSGMHEAYQKTKDAKRAVRDGFGAGSKVVTAAAIIMISVFGGFMTNHETVIQSIGFGLAVGILVDAFIVRMTIVPAVMTLLGKSAWWLPKWLDKRLPHISIEGESDEPTKK
jgi:RND superfamily putative drug exporter